MFCSQSNELNHVCVFWDSTEEGGTWSPRGCRTVDSNSEYTVCSCSHLSSFAVLMALYQMEARNLNNESQKLMAQCHSLYLVFKHHLSFSTGPVWAAADDILGPFPFTRLPVCLHSDILNDPLHPKPKNYHPFAPVHQPLSCLPHLCNINFSDQKPGK